MDTLLIFFVNRSFMHIVEKNQKPVFFKFRVLPVSVYNLKWRANRNLEPGAQNFKFINFIYATLIG